MASTLLVLSVVGTARADVVDRIVSVVARDVVTASDVALEEAISARDVSPLPPLRVGEALRRVEDQRILLLLAGRIKLYQPDSGAVEDRLRNFRETFTLRADYTEFLRVWGFDVHGLPEVLDVHGLHEVLRLRMVCERYLLRNVGLGLGEDPTDEAWLEAYEAFMEPHRQDAGIRRIAEW